MVGEATAENGGDRHGVVTRVAIQLGVSSESVGGWVKQAEIDRGLQNGLPTYERQRLAELGEGEPRTAASKRDPQAASTLFSGGARPATATL